MKRILFFAALLSCSMLSCKKREKLSLTGVYKLEKQMITGGGTDSTYARTQIKFYINNHFMYAGMTLDSSVGFGVGTYVSDTGNRIIEHRFYSSWTLDSARTFKLDIIRKDSGFMQKIPALAVTKGVKYDLVEDYIKLQTGDSSKLDGLWKLDKTYMVKGKDTLAHQETQYKIFWGGYFMFVQRYPLDKEATKFRNNFGYGPFSFKNDQLNEEEQISSYAFLRNHKFDVKVTFKGNDEYTQVINDPKTNEQTTEIYKRVK